MKKNQTNGITYMKLIESKKRQIEEILNDLDDNYRDVFFKSLDLEVCYDTEEFKYKVFFHFGI